ncbi:MAG: MOSC domain-containing protein, partial [Proteobacteria bacterium]|nr:MOSC domain-containing protein [Pseudomonadota bacterium]
DRLVIDGTVVLEVTQIGKECHNDGCAIKKATGDCIMPKEGIFTRVIHGGVVKAGLAIDIERISGATRVA